jgi:mannose-1-phosphate guanylyltransferase
MEVDHRKVNRPEQAVILCGGLGTRMRPYTNTMPKPMVTCNGKPFLWHLLHQLHENGVCRFFLLTGYRAEQIEEYFKNGSEWDWQIQYYILTILFLFQWIKFLLSMKEIDQL